MRVAHLRWQRGNEPSATPPGTSSASSSRTQHPPDGRSFDCQAARALLRIRNKIRIRIRLPDELAKGFTRTLRVPPREETAGRHRLHRRSHLRRGV